MATQSLSFPSHSCELHAVIHLLVARLFPGS